VIQGVSGTVNGNAITGLSLFGSADNLLLSPVTPNAFDFHGFGFMTTGESFNLFGDFFTTGGAPGATGELGGNHGVDECNSLVSGTCNQGHSTGFPTTSFSIAPSVVAAVPEPETFALMGLGLAVVGFASRKRRQR
jgi:hypothetical protein